MDYSITKKRDYSWMSQASYLDFQGLLAYNDESLKLKLNDSPINALKARVGRTRLRYAA